VRGRTRTGGDPLRPESRLRPKGVQGASPPGGTQATRELADGPLNPARSASRVRARKGRCGRYVSAVTERPMASRPDAARAVALTWSLSVEARRRSIGCMWGRITALPLGLRLYGLFWTLLVPAGVILVLAGAVIPGLVLLVLFVFDQAVFTPLIVARSQRQHRAKRRPSE
jgi:hypothetical protein